MYKNVSLMVIILTIPLRRKHFPYKKWGLFAILPAMNNETNHNKLARDKIHEILEAKGVRFESRILNDQEYGRELGLKLQEEVKELLEAKDVDHLVEEMADVVEVIHAMLARKGKTFEDLEAVRESKLAARGGFYKKIFLKKTFS